MSAFPVGTALVAGDGCILSLSPELPLTTSVTETYALYRELPPDPARALHCHGITRKVANSVYVIAP